MNNDKQIASTDISQRSDVVSARVTYICFAILVMVFFSIAFVFSPLEKLYEDLHAYSDGSSVYNMIEHKEIQKELDEEFGDEFDWEFKQLRRIP